MEKLRKATVCGRCTRDGRQHTLTKGPWNRTRWTEMAACDIFGRQGDFMPTNAKIPLVAPAVDSHTMALIRLAVGEDLGREGHAAVTGGRKFPAGDKTVELAIPAELRGTARI